MIEQKQFLPTNGIYNLSVANLLSGMYILQVVKWPPSRLKQNGVFSRLDHSPNYLMDHLSELLLFPCHVSLYSPLLVGDFFYSVYYNFRIDPVDG